MAAVPLAALMLTYLVVFRDGAKSTGRWGVRRRAVEVGASPYRAHTSHEELAQGAPWSLRLLSWLAAMAGVVTTGLLAPAGLMLIFVVLDRGTGLGSLLVFGISASGFPAGVVLIQVARRLTKNEPIKRTSFDYLYGHHLAVVLVTMFVDSGSQGGNFIGAFSAGVCIVFVVLIALLHRAAQIEEPGTPSTES